MAARPVWKGQLRLSLVSIPVEMFSATERSSAVSFRQIHKPSGQPVKYEKTVPGVGPIDTSEIVKGYEVEKDEYVLIEPDEIEDIRLESKKTLELVQFVGACDIPPLYFDKPYFLTPQDELAEDAYRVLRDALASSGKTGLGQLAMRGREHLVAVRPCASGLMLETLHYEAEIRKTDGFFSSISGAAADKDLVGVAEELIERKSKPFDAAAFKDSYTEAIRELVARKAKGRKPAKAAPKGEARGGDNVVDLMSALKESLKSSGAKKAPAKPAAKKPATRSTAKKSA